MLRAALALCWFMPLRTSFVGKDHHYLEPEVVLEYVPFLTAGIERKRRRWLNPVDVLVERLLRKSVKSHWRREGAVPGPRYLPVTVTLSSRPRAGDNPTIVTWKTKSDCTSQLQRIFSWAPSAYLYTKHHKLAYTIRILVIWNALAFWIFIGEMQWVNFKVTTPQRKLSPIAAHRAVWFAESCWIPRVSIWWYLWCYM